MVTPNYLYINGDFRVLARDSSVYYGTQQEHGRLVAGALQLQKAIDMADEVLQKNPGKYPCGIRISDAALEHARAIDRSIELQRAAKQAAEEALYEEYGGYYGGY